MQDAPAARTLSSAGRAGHLEQGARRAAYRRLLSAFASGDAADAARRRLAPLTDREREVAAAVARGLSGAEIEGALYLSASTVKVHIGRIMTKVK